jgi:hypothetical protein
MYVGMRTTSRGMRSVIHELSIGLKRLTSLRPAFGDGFVDISGSYGGGGAVGGLLQSELLTTKSGGDRIISVSRFHAVATMPTTTTTTIIGAESRSSSLLLPAMALPLVIILLVHLFWFSLACMHSSEILAIAGLSLVLILR